MAHEAYVYHIMASVKKTPSQIEESDVLILADTMEAAKSIYENFLMPKTVYHYHMIADQGKVIHE